MIDRSGKGILQPGLADLPLWICLSKWAVKSLAQTLNGLIPKNHMLADEKKYSVRKIKLLLIL